MDKLTRFAIDNSRFTILFLVALIVGGLATFSTQPRQEDPEIIMRGAQVVAQFPGLAPERVEQLITRPIEDAIKQIPEVDEIKSISMSGLSIVTPEAGAQYVDMDPIWADLRNKMDDLAPSLPEGTQGPSVNDDFGRVAVITMALTGGAFSMAELAEVARDLRDEFGALELVAKVDLFGVQDERIWLEFDSDFMLQFGLDPVSLFSAIQGQNVVLPGGSIDAAGQRIVIEPSGDFQSLEELRNTTVVSPDGGLIYLRDLAQIRRDYVDPPKSPAYFNGKPAVVLGISMVGGSNVVELGRQVRDRLAQLRPLLPLGMSLDIAIFQPDLVQASVDSATENLLQTIAVVLIVVMGFLGWRTGLIVGSMVPLTMMATLIGMSIWGIELHRISIAAIIVALGLLVDNGVVIAEDIRQRLDAGEERLKAALSTPANLAVPLLTSSLTTVLAFMPLMLISDSTGEFLRSLGQVLMLALLTSWFLSITVTPAFCYWFLPASQASETSNSEQRYQGRAYQWYAALLGFFLRRRILLVAIMIAALFAAGSIFSHVKQRSLGPSERNQFTVYLDLPAGTDIRVTEGATQRLVSYLLERETNPEVTDVISYIGGGGPRFFLALSPNDPQSNKGFMVVNTQTADQIGAVMSRVENYIVESIPEATGRADLLFLGPAALGTVELQVIGPNIDTLRYLGTQIQGAFNSVDGITAVRSDWENAVLKLKVNVDQERARRAGVSSQEIARTLSAHFDGEVVTTYRERDKSIPVVVRAQGDARGNLDRMRTIEVRSQDGEPVPLLQIADFEGVVEPSKILRIDQKRALTVAGKHPGMTAVELYAAMQPALQKIEIPAGYELNLEGEIKGSQESNGALFEFAPHALFGILVLLVLQFGSFRRSALVLLTIPLILIGANFGLLIFDAFFDFTGMLGLFSLAGIIINNGIVLIDRIDTERQRGLAVNEAITAASLARARPIIMTTITTIVGLLPLALFGGEFWYGMAIVIMCGLGVGTILTLGFVPVVYSLLFSGFGGSAQPEAAAEEAVA